MVAHLADTTVTQSHGDPDLEAAVSCGKWVRADRGTLYLRKARLRFQTGERCVFDVTVSGIEKITWHWYSFGAAFEATIGGTSYFLSFMPRYAGLGDWNAALAAGRRWRAALEGRPLPTGAPIFARVFSGVTQLLWLFFLGCALLLGLELATDESASIGYRIGAGVMLLAVLIQFCALLWQAVRSLFVKRGR
jgi:hypothetical protein